MDPKTVVLPERVRNIFGEIAEALGGDEPDIKRAQKAAEELMQWQESDEARGYAATPELIKQTEQLCKRLDAQQQEIRDIRRAGLATRGGQIIVPGRRARLDMLADGRAFASDETAERFGAYAAWRLARDQDERDRLPQRTREIAQEIIKEAREGRKAAGDMDLTAGSGAEFMPDEFRRELIRDVEAVGRVYTLCQRVPLSTLGQTIWPKHVTGLTAHPVAVLAEIEKSAPGLGTVTLTPVKWGTLTGVPNELLRTPATLVDAGQYIGILVVYGLAEAFDNAVLNGDGTASYGGITGILQSANIAAVAAAATHTTVATLDGTDVSNVIAGLSVEYALQNARWIQSLSVKGHLRALKATTGMSLYERGNQGEPNTIDGYPYTISNKMPAKGAITAGDPWAVYGDLRLSHMFGMVGNIRIDRSEHVYFASDATAIRGIAEVDCAERNADAVVVAETAAE